MLTASHITKQFAGKNAVDDVSFELSPGEVLGFLGPNGAGKTTTMRIIAGYLRPTSGEVVVDGVRMDEQPELAKSHIGYLPENAPAYQESSVEGFLNFIGKVRGLGRAECKQAVSKAMALCHLEEVRLQTIGTLSKGYRHRVGFAQAILANPSLLILDEPTDGLDPNQKHEMRQLIREMGKSRAIIVSTHILEEVEAICTRVIIINHGRIIFNGTPASLRARSSNTGCALLRFTEERPLNQIKSLFGPLPFVRSIETVEHEGRPFIRIVPEGGDQPDLFLSKLRHFCAERHLETAECLLEQGSLEEVFRKLTMGDKSRQKEVP